MTAYGLSLRVGALLSRPCFEAPAARLRAECIRWRKSDELDVHALMLESGFLMAGCGRRCGGGGGFGYPFRFV